MQDSTFLAFIIYVLSRIVKHSNLTIFLEQPFESFPEGNDPGPGQKVVDQQSADGGLDGAPADRKSTRLNSSHTLASRMPSSA